MSVVWWGRKWMSKWVWGRPEWMKELMNEQVLHSQNTGWAAPSEELWDSLWGWELISSWVRVLGSLSPHLWKKQMKHLLYIFLFSRVTRPQPLLLGTFWPPHGALFSRGGWRDPKKLMRIVGSIRTWAFIPVSLPCLLTTSSQSPSHQGTVGLDVGLEPTRSDSFLWRMSEHWQCAQKPELIKFK